MDSSDFPTKRNLIDAKHGLKLAQQGYDLLDKKRQVLLLELSDVKSASLLLCAELEKKITEARKILAKAIIFMGGSVVDKIGNKMLIDNSIEVSYRRIMGVSLPQVKKRDCMPGSETESDFHGNKKNPPFELGKSSAYLDEAFLAWMEVKRTILSAAEAQTAVKLLTAEMRRAQKRASALKNITIPTYEARIKYISDQLEERERDELARIKKSR